MQTENRQFRTLRETGAMTLFSEASPEVAQETQVPASLVVTKRQETAAKIHDLTIKEYVDSDFSNFSC